MLTCFKSFLCFLLLYLTSTRATKDANIYARDASTKGICNGNACIKGICLKNACTRGASLKSAYVKDADTEVVYIESTFIKDFYI